MERVEELLSQKRREYLKQQKAELILKFKSATQRALAKFITFNISIFILYSGLLLLGIEVPMNFKMWAGICLVGWAVKTLYTTLFKSWGVLMKDSEYVIQKYKEQQERRKQYIRID